MYHPIPTCCMLEVPHSPLDPHQEYLPPPSLVSCPVSAHLVWERDYTNLQAKMFQLPKVQRFINAVLKDGQLYRHPSTVSVAHTMTVTQWRVYDIHSSFSSSSSSPSSSLLRYSPPACLQLKFLQVSRFSFLEDLGSKRR